MKKKHLIKNLSIILISFCLITSTKAFATTTPLWRQILNNLRNEWWTDDEIREKIEDLWYDASEYLWKKENNNDSNNKATLKTTESWRKIINNLREKWRTDDEIRKKIEDLWYDASWYFWKKWNQTNNLSINISNKNPEINERIKLVIDINKEYTWKVYFPKLEYYNTASEKRINIDITSSKYISDYWDDLDLGYTRFNISDKWNIIISKFVKFAKSGKYRIYAEDIDWNEDYVQITIKSDDKENDKNSEDDNSENIKLELSTDATNLSINEPIDIKIKADDYIGKLSLYAKYRELISNYRITLSNTSHEYFRDYSDVWEDWYYKMNSSDNGKKNLLNLVEFKKPWTYRIYAENNEWYTNFVQIYVNSNNTNPDNTNSNEKTSNTNNHSSNTNYYSSNSNKNNEMEDFLKELLNTWNNSTTQKDIERNKNNIKNFDEEIYISRSCKQYRIQYITWMWVFTSPDMQKKEYFLNKDYLKRYIDSKNPQKEMCPQNSWWISNSYSDKSESTSNYIAPNWKVYFITQQNWYFTSNELNNKKDFNSISTLKYYIRDRNPLIRMNI